MTAKLALICAFTLVVVPTLIHAAERDEGPPWRYQLAVRQGVAGDTLFMIDTATGHTWRLQSVPAQTASGAPGTVERWFPIEVDNQPMPPEPVTAPK
jgi:hypothetical protein